MPWTYPKLLREIDRERLPTGAFEEFQRRRGEAYDYLMQSLSENSLNDRQAGHAVKILLHLRLYKDHQEQKRFYSLLIPWATDERREVRSEAAVALIQLALPRKEHYAEYQLAINTAKQALQMGLKPSCERWMKEVLSWADRDD